MCYNGSSHIECNSKVSLSALHYVMSYWGCKLEQTALIVLLSASRYSKSNALRINVKLRIMRHRCMEPASMLLAKLLLLLLM
jgi:hypothetical protein